MTSLFTDLPELPNEKPDHQIVYGDELSQFSYPDFLAQQQAFKELLAKLEPQVIAWFGKITFFDSSKQSISSEPQVNTVPAKDFHPAVAALMSPSGVAL